jgi:hypothetical protein
MAAEQFVISQVNPNDTVGGGGCVCDEEHQTDCKPPYIVFSDTLMDSPISPNTVLCARCARLAIAKLDEAEASGDMLIVGNVGDEMSIQDAVSRKVQAPDDDEVPEI